MPVNPDFEQIIQQNPKLWARATPEQRDEYISTWARRRATEEGATKPQMDEWIDQARGVSEHYLVGAPMPDVKAPPEKLGWWEYPLRALEAPGQYLLSAATQPPDRPWYGRITDPFVHTGKFMVGGKRVEPPAWLPGSELAKRIYTDPLTYWGGVGLLKGAGRYALGKLPTFKKAGGALLQGTRGRLTPPTAPTSVGAPPTPWTPSGPAVPIPPPSVPSAPGTLFKGQVPTLPPSAAATTGRRVVTPGQYMGPRPTAPVATPHGLVQQLRSHFVPDEAKQVVQFVTQNPRDPLSKRILAGQFDKATLQEINDRLFRLTQPKAAKPQPPPAAPRPAEMAPTAAEEVQGMAHGQYGDFLKGVQ